MEAEICEQQYRPSANKTSEGELLRRAYGRSCMEAGHSALKVAWLVLVTVSILVKGEIK
jgi:hypothetical protein